MSERDELSLRERVALRLLEAIVSGSGDGDRSSWIKAAREMADEFLAASTPEPAESRPVTDAEVRVYQRAVADYVDNCVVQKMDADAGTRAGLTAAFALREGRS